MATTSLRSPSRFHPPRAAREARVATDAAAPGHAMLALGYVRRSKESGGRTVSLEDQRERIAAYCGAPTTA